MPRESNIKIRRGSSSQWNNTDSILNPGEPGWDFTNKILKIGDGENKWGKLDVVNSNLNYSTHSEFIGDGSSNVYIINHNLNAMDNVFVMVKDTTTNNLVYPDI
jgi:hypothetical protein